MYIFFQKIARLSTDKGRIQQQYVYAFVQFKLYTT